MAKKVLETYLGRVYKLAHNPRQMSDGAFTKLVESLMRKDGDEQHGDIEFLGAKRIVVWLVPNHLPEGREWPFSGQEGKMVVLGGNQRYDALIQLKYDRIPDEWITAGRYADGKWWSPEAAERFILLDNNPEGISGETDYDELIKRFNEECLKAVGMDFAPADLDFQYRMSEPVEDEVEQGENGEQDQELHDFIQRRENSRGNVGEMLDCGFYCVTVFETHAQKMEYLEFLREKYGIEANREVFINGFMMAEAQGKKIEYSGLKFPEGKPSAALQEMAMDGTAEGWEKGSEALPEGTSAEEDETEKVEDGSGIDGII